MEYNSIYIDIDNFLNVIRDRSFIERLQKMSSYCRAKSSGKGVILYNTPYEMLTNFPAAPDHVRLLLLVLPRDFVVRYTNNQDLAFADLNNGTIFENSIGHCFLGWDKTIDICGIFDVCIHERYLNTPKMGSKLMEQITDFLATFLPIAVCSDNLLGQKKCLNTIIWLCVDLDNVNFTNVVHLYTKFGFSNPFVNFIDPFGFDWSTSTPNGFLSLSRVNNFLIPSKIDRNAGLSRVIYTLKQYLNNQEVAGIPVSLRSLISKTSNEFRGACTMYLFFNREYADILRKLPYSSVSLNSDGTLTQKEIAGRLILTNPQQDKDKDNIKWEIIFDTKTLLFGREGDIYPDIGQYSFHTHPNEFYNKPHFVPSLDREALVTVCYPSEKDYAGILFKVVNEDLSFHTVVTREGIYIIYLKLYWLLRLSEFKEAYADTVKGLGNPTIATATFKIMSKYWGIQFTDMTIAESCKHYAKLISQQAVFLPDPEPVFGCEFFTWEEILAGQVFEVTYARLNDQCFPTSSSLKNFNRIKFSLDEIMVESDDESMSD